ncbi:MAG: DUF4956 domain-containing protein [Eubacteriaceae bacterium]|jgi:hypothetical protein
MLDTILSSVVDETLTLGTTLSVLFSALALGLLISIVYIKTRGKEGYSPGFTITLIMLPTIIAIIILLVGNNVARAFSLAGAFSLIRFRSAPGDPIDIAYVFFTLGIGLACGMGYIFYGVIFAIILCCVMIILSVTHFAQPRNSKMQLKITVPEDLDYQDSFDDILDDYTDSYRIQRVKTCDFGSLFEVFYSIQLKNSVDQKEFIDRLRCRNGNLTIVMNFEIPEEKIFI